MACWRDTIAGLLMLGVIMGGGDFAQAKSEKELLAIKQARVRLPEAIAVAQREVPGGRVIDADIVRIRGAMSYAIEILKDGIHIVRIDLQNGGVLNKSFRRVPARSWKQMAMVEAAKVTLVDAIFLAEAALPGGVVASADISMTRSGPRYVVDIEKDGLFEVHVDFQDGRILDISERLDE
jgi:uncharacterized membrane protein YkoI